MSFDSKQPDRCVCCGAKPSHLYQHFRFGDASEPLAQTSLSLCVRCARAERRRQRGELSNCVDHSMGTSRDELIKELDRYFEESGATEICKLCHEQGTGCCPSSCRALGPEGCTGKNLWCGIFVCGALANAIALCDAETARILRRAKNEIGPIEFRIYEMMTRVPAQFREPERPLILPARYPNLIGLGEGAAIRDQLLAMSKDILEIRRRWHEEELRELPD